MSGIIGRYRIRCLLSQRIQYNGSGLTGTSAIMGISQAGELPQTGCKLPLVAMDHGPFKPLASISSTWWDSIGVSGRFFASVSSRGRRKQERSKPLPHKNDEITSPTLRVVFSDGDSNETKILPLEEARKEAAMRNLDLVMASPTAHPPVARITSWEKLVFSIRKKEKAAERAARENKKLAAPKEIRVGCRIESHDMAVKLASARKILVDKHPVKLCVTFKGGREIGPAKDVLDNLLGELSDVGKIKDPKHLEKPQMNRWLVQLEPKLEHQPNAQ